MNTLEYYDRNASEYAKETADADMAVQYGFFEKYLEGSARILDLGCGAGRDTKYFLEKGYTVTAVDGSPELCKFAASYTGCEVTCKLFQDIDFKNEFDAVWACASLLHLTSSDLVIVLQKIATALKPNGICYASFKYGTFEGTRDDRYYKDQTEATIAQLLGQVEGFTLVETFVSTDVRPTHSAEPWLNIILRKNKIWR